MSLTQEDRDVIMTLVTGIDTLKAAVADLTATVADLLADREEAEADGPKLNSLDDEADE